MPLKAVNSYRQFEDSGLSFNLQYESDPDLRIHRKRPKIDIGDERLSTFDGSLYMSGWNDEVFFKIFLPPVISRNFITPDDDQHSECLECDHGDHKQRFYVMSDPEDDDDVFEWEIIFNSRPAQNSITLDIDFDGLDFWKQDFTPEELADPSLFIPERVLGSYALYHSTKAHNVNKSDGTREEYQTGKFGHIFRPKLVDSLGVEKYCDLEIDVINKKLTLSMDRQWLRNASYPVTLDPTIGYSTQGASEDPHADDEVIFAFNNDRHNPSADGTIDNVNCIIREQTNSNMEIGVAVYSYISATFMASNLLIDSDTQSFNLGTTFPRTITMSNVTGNTVYAGTLYFCAFRFNDNGGTVCRILFDSSSQLTKRRTGQSSFPGTMNLATNYSSRAYSMYADYTEGSAPIVPSAITMVLATTNPAVVLGDVTIAPSAITMVMATTNPSVTLGDVTISPSAISMVLATVDPSVTLGSISISPDASTMVLATTNPTVILGDLTIVPNAITMVLATTDPPVTAGSAVLVTPDPITMVMATVNPDVVLGTLTLTPAAITMILATVNPAIIFGSVTIVPDPITMVLATGSVDVTAGIVNLITDGSNAIYNLLSGSAHIDESTPGLIVEARNAVFTLLQNKVDI